MGKRRGEADEPDADENAGLIVEDFGAGALVGEGDGDGSGVVDPVEVRSSALYCRLCGKRLVVARTMRSADNPNVLIRYMRCPDHELCRGKWVGVERLALSRGR